MGAPTPPVPAAPDNPVRRCQCGNPIGDGDWCAGHRFCAVCRPRRSRPGRYTPGIPRPRAGSLLPRAGVFRLP